MGFMRRSVDEWYLGDWSSGMIPASGAGGHGFNSRIAPIFVYNTHSTSRSNRLYFCVPKYHLYDPSPHSFIIASMAINSNNTAMHSITLDSTEAEEIIKLRVDLARTKNKLAKYEEFMAKMDQFDQQINYLLRYFNSRENVIQELCSQLGIEMKP
jgi:hypothetical protein